MYFGLCKTPVASLSNILQEFNKLENLSYVRNISFLFQDIHKRQDCIKVLTSAGETGAEQLANIMPDYMLAFGISILAHQVEFESHEVSQVFQTSVWPGG